MHTGFAEGETPREGPSAAGFARQALLGAPDAGLSSGGRASPGGTSTVPIVKSVITIFGSLSSTRSTPTRQERRKVEFIRPLQVSTYLL